MKNNRITRAYDSINPSPADKAKMLDAILAEANLPEEPPKPKKQRKEPVVYTARATKSSKRSILGGLAACLAVFVIGGTFLARMLGGEPVDPVYVEPTTDVTITGTKYDAVLAKYRAALKEGWTKDQCEIEGITTRMEAGGDFTKLGYALLDLDGDGREELIIAEESTDQTDNIWDLYTTLEDGTPIQLWVDERSGGQCRLYEGNVISISDSYKDELEQTFYDLQDGKFVIREMLQWEDEDTVFHTDAEGNTRQVTSREGQNISYAYENQKLNLTWLADIPDSLRDTEALELYTPILEKYRTALAEGWDRIMCRENNLSMRTPIENEGESLYYALYDLNEDGIKELIISEYPYREDTDTSFIDIFTRVDGEVKNAMSIFELVEMRSLCEGGYVKDLFLEPGMEYDKYAGFWKLEEDRFVTDFKVYQKSGQWFTEGYRGVGTAITREEADEIVANYPPLKLEFIEIRPSGEAESLSGYEAFDLIIQKYVNAINEGWTEAQCEQNDISPQIFGDTAIQRDLGWCLLDIDKNGVEELIISDGVYLYDLYVMMPHDGSPGHLIMHNAPADHYMLCKDGTIEYRSFFSKGSSWKYYRLSGLDLVLEDILVYRNEYEGTTAAEMYYYGRDEDNTQPISKAEAGNIIVSTDKCAMELDLTRFVEPAPFEPDEMEYYAPLLELYRQAIREDWGPGDCAQMGIGMMVGYYGDFVEELGYTMMDLDNNGIQELIVTDGTNIYDLYTIIQDEEVGPLRLIDAMERIQYFLLDDGRIYCLGSGSASVSYYTFYQLEGRELKLLEGYMLDLETNPMLSNTDPENPWYYYDGTEQGEPCPRETAVAAIDPVVFAHIPFTSFE